MDLRLRYIVLLLAVVLPLRDACAQDEGHINALEYSLQKRYRPKGERFVNEKFADNTFLSVGIGAEQLVPTGMSAYSWGPKTELSYGKWLDPYNALRVTLGAGEFYRNRDDMRIRNVGLSVSHMFNISSYLGGYRPSRFCEVSTVEGLGYIYSFPDGKGTHVLGAHLGFNVRLRVWKTTDFFVEPLVDIYSDGIDHSGAWNWHHYDVGYGARMGLSFRMHSDSEHYGTGNSHDGKSFISIIGGGQYQNSALVYETLGVGKAIGPHAALAFGRWYSRTFAVRASAFWSKDNWGYYNDVLRVGHYAGLRVEGMLDVLGLALGRDKETAWKLSLLFGPETGFMLKKDDPEDLRRLYFGLSGGVQASCRLAGFVSIFVEPRFSIVPYSHCKTKTDPLERVRANYFDGLLNLNFGFTFDLPI